MGVYQQGTINLAALTVDDIYVVVARPASTSVQGVDTGIVGLVGGASWGPVNVPILMGSPTEVAQKFGPLSLNPNDLPTDALIVMQQGVAKVVGVRATDGTDAKAAGTLGAPGTAASGTVTIAGVPAQGNTLTVTLNGVATSYVLGAAPTVSTAAAGLAAALNANVAIAAAFEIEAEAGVVTITSKTAGVEGNAVTLAASAGGAGATVTVSGATLSGGTIGAAIAEFEAKYSGEEGNNITVTAVPGSNSTVAAPTWTIRVAKSGVAPVAEVFPNLPEANLGAAIVNAVNNGLSVGRPASELVTATVGATPNAAPSLLSVALVGGTNGDTALSTAHLLGNAAAVPATGMYALDGQGVQQFALCGNTDSNSWGLQIGFAQSIGALASIAFPAATSTANAVNMKKAAGGDSPYGHFCKDFVQFYDTYNNALRLISPAAFALGRIASLSPERSPGNKPIVGVVATERTLAKQPYSNAELTQLFAAGINVITNPVPGGSYFALRHGLNGSSDSAVNGVEYTRMTNFLAYSLNQSFGKYIDEVQTAQPDDPTREAARISLINFLAGLKNPNNRMIDDFSVDMAFGEGKTNSPASVAAGYMNAVVRVKYLSIVRFFVVTLVGGRTVDVAVK